MGIGDCLRRGNCAALPSNNIKTTPLKLLHTNICHTAGHKKVKRRVSNQFRSNHFLREEVIPMAIKRFNGFIKKLLGYRRCYPIDV
jgi:hypothetical protein